MPKKIQEATTALKLIKKFALVGSVSPRLDETIVPVVVVDELLDEEEWKYAFLNDERPAVAAQFNTWELNNPAGSGKVLQLVEASYSPGVLAQFLVHVSSTTATLATNLSPIFEDLNDINVAPNRFPAGEVFWESLVAALGVVMVFRSRIIPAQNVNIITYRPGNVLIYPNQSIWFQGFIANVAASMNIEWRERVLRPDGS